MSTLGSGLNKIEDIQALIEAPVRESQGLEYKTATKKFTDSEKGEISKDVSAMANSGGGTIIYGISTDPSDKTRPQAIEPIANVNIETFGYYNEFDHMTFSAGNAGSGYTGVKNLRLSRVIVV